MENNMLVSVVVPVYNVEKYLEECLDSIIAQTYQNWEMILVDDGSVDSSGDICDKYAEKDPRISVVHKKNGGASTARNAGITHCKGDYIYFLDSDDYLAKNALELLNCAAQDLPDIIYFDAVTFAERDYSGAININGYIRTHQYPDDTGANAAWLMFANKEFHYGVPLLFFKRDFLQKSVLHFKEGIIYEDMIFTFEAFMRASRVKYLNQTLYHRRYRPNSVMTSKKRMLSYKSARTVYDEIKLLYEQGGQHGDLCRGYLAGRAITVINKFEQLDKVDKKLVLDDYTSFKRDVRQNNAFGDKALLLRCDSKLKWFVYKALKKIF